MTNKQLLTNLANVPLAQPGFDALGISAPVIVQMNQSGKWENSKPGDLDEERLKAIVQHLVSSDALSAAQSYCCQCSEENQKGLTNSEKSNYIPVIMMPLYSADECPFDMKCEINKIKENESKVAKKGVKKTDISKQADKESYSADKKKSKKRGFVMQRLTDFDLLSQW